MTGDIVILGTGDSSDDFSRLPDPIDALDHHVFRPVLTPVPGAVFPASPEARQVTVEAYLAAGKRWAENGCAALYINTMGDYGLGALRDVVDIPVIGSGEASIRAAMSMGQSFSIVTIWPPRMKFIYDHVLKDASAGDTFRSIHFLSADEELETMGQGGDFYSNMQACHFTTLTQVRQTMRQALDQEGADTVILGCTCMSSMAPILKAEGFPVVEPMATGYLYAEFLASVASGKSNEQFC